MNSMRSKPAVKSLGILGGIGSLVGIIGLVTELREFIAANPDLVDETRVTILGLFAAVSALVSVIGRWKAVLPIKGLIKAKR